jgi:hypothetical protein
VFVLENSLLVADLTFKFGKAFYVKIQKLDLCSFIANRKICGGPRL